MVLRFVRTPLEDFIEVVEVLQKVGKPTFAKTRVFLKKPTGLGFFGFYWVLLGIFGFYWGFLGFY